MIKVKRKKAPLLVKTAVFNAIMCCMISHYASAAENTITTDTTISGDHTSATDPDTYLVESGTLTVAGDTILNNNNPNRNVILGKNNSTIIVNGGANITGLINQSGMAKLILGSGSTTPVIIKGSILMTDTANTVFDHVSLLNPSPLGPTNGLKAIEMRDKASATFSANSILKSESYDVINLVNESLVVLNGSTIQGYSAGASITDQSRLISNGANMSGELNGLIVYNSATAIVSGGTLSALTGGAIGGAPDLAGRYGQYGAALDVVGVGLDDAAGAGTIVNVTIDSARLVATNGSSVGVSTQTYGKSVSNINISNSTISAAKYGIVSDYDTVVNSDPNEGDGDPAAGSSNVTLTHTQVTSGEDSLHVNAKAKADIIIQSGSTLVSKNNILLASGADSVTNLTVDNSQVTGDINNLGTSNVSLKNGATLTGATSNVSNMVLDAGTQWDVTKSSSVSGNLSNSGTVSLAQASTPGNVLTVGGNYVGNNGNLLLNTALKDDASVTDKLVIGGTASGTTNVSVTNLGGSGAATVNGISVINVAGASAAGAFIQRGRIVAGAFDYTLLQKGNNWVLSSVKSDPVVGPDPIPDPTPDPTPNPVPTPNDMVVRPEAGSYMANIAAANTMFQAGLHDRLGETRYINPVNGQWDVTSLWLRQVGRHGSFKDGTGQLKTTSNTYVAQLGGDIAQWSTTDKNRWHVGLMAGYGNSKNSTESAVSGNKSRGSVDGYSVGAYGTWFANDVDHTGAFIDSQVQYAWFNNHVNGDEIDSESYKSKGLTASLETGYTFAVGQSGSVNNPTRYFIEPHVQATWMGIKADDLRESNGTHVSSQGDDNVQTRVGVRAFMQGHSSKEIVKDRSFQPFVELNWLHNTKRFGTTMDGVSLQQTGAVNVGEAKVGVEGQLSKSTQLWGNVGQQIGDQGYNNSEAMVGIKYSF